MKGTSQEKTKRKYDLELTQVSETGDVEVDNKKQLLKKLKNSGKEHKPQYDDASKREVQKITQLTLKIPEEQTQVARNIYIKQRNSCKAILQMKDSLKTNELRTFLSSRKT